MIIKNKIIIKIPFEIENEFENNYNVDDLLLGKNKSYRNL